MLIRPQYGTNFCFPKLLPPSAYFLLWQVAVRPTNKLLMESLSSAYLHILLEKRLKKNDFSDKNMQTCFQIKAFSNFWNFGSDYIIPFCGMISILYNFYGPITKVLYWRQDKVSVLSCDNLFLLEKTFYM